MLYFSANFVAGEWQMFLLAHRRWGTFREEERLRLSDSNSILMTQNPVRSANWSMEQFHCSSYCLRMTDKRQKAAKVNCKRNESPTKQSILFCGIQSSLKEAFEFCWSSFADQHNALPKSTRRNIKLNKFAIRTPWLPDLLCKHLFPPRKTSLSVDEQGETSAVCRLRMKGLWLNLCWLCIAKLYPRVK